MSVNDMWENITVYCENKLYRKRRILSAVLGGVLNTDYDQNCQPDCHCNKIPVKPKLKVTLPKRKESLRDLAAILSKTILKARRPPNFISNIFG